MAYGQMVVDEAQFINIFKGKRIKLTLKTSSFIGVVQRINPNKTLVLADVANASNGCKIPGSKLFFGHEILNVEFTGDANGDSGKVIDHHLAVEEFQPYRKTMTIDNDEGEEECIDFVVIDEFHEKFVPAVIHIKKQHTIGVGSNGVEVFKHGRLCWLQIATKNKVYLFDILLLGARAFKNGLSTILESKAILKVMHDCRAIAGCLVAQFGVQLTNVFDTLVADVMCFHTETGGFLPDRVSTLQEVVSLHLKVPPSQLLSLQIKSQLTKEENEMWYVRPCPVALLKVMALSVIHLLPLRQVLLDALMTDYMALVDSYITNSQFNPEDLENVGKKSVLALPKELRQLQQMHHERQEQAAKHYPVTEEGLLARFKPRTEPPSLTSPSPDEDSRAQAESFGPAAVELPSSAQQDQQLPSPPKVTSVASLDVCASTVPVAATVAAFGKTLPSAGIGCTEELIKTIGRGKPVVKEQSTPCALPGIGRGFFFQMPPVQIPRESVGDVKSPGLMVTTSPCSLKTMPEPETGACATVLPKDAFGLREDLSPTSVHEKSFMMKEGFGFLDLFMPVYPNKVLLFMSPGGRNRALVTQ